MRRGRSRHVPSRHHAAACATRRARSRAFTLLELIVVITIIAILAAVFLPRLTGQSQRAAEAEAAAVQRLLTAAAERAAMDGGQRLAIRYSTEDDRASLSMVVRNDRAAAGTARRGMDADWRQDLLVEPVEFSHLELTQATLDGRRLDPRKWFASLGSAQVRPSLSILLSPRGNATPTAYRIELTPDGLTAVTTSIPAAQLTTSGRAPQAPPARAIDLDATGRGDSPW